MQRPKPEEPLNTIRDSIQEIFDNDKTELIAIVEACIYYERAKILLRKKGLANEIAELRKLFEPILKFKEHILKGYEKYLSVDVSKYENAVIPDAVKENIYAGVDLYIQNIGVPITLDEATPLKLARIFLDYIYNGKFFDCLAMRLRIGINFDKIEIFFKQLNRKHSNQFEVIGNHIRGAFQGSTKRSQGYQQAGNSIHDAVRRYSTYTKLESPLSQISALLGKAGEIYSELLDICIELYKLQSRTFGISFGAKIKKKQTGKKLLKKRRGIIRNEIVEKQKKLNTLEGSLRRHAEDQLHYEESHLKKERADIKGLKKRIQDLELEERKLTSKIGVTIKQLEERRANLLKDEQALRQWLSILSREISRTDVDKPPLPPKPHTSPDVEFNRPNLTRERGASVTDSGRYLMAKAAGVRQMASHAREKFCNSPLVRRKTLKRSKSSTFAGNSTAGITPEDGPEIHKRSESLKIRNDDRGATLPVRRRATVAGAQHVQKPPASKAITSESLSKSNDDSNTTLDSSKGYVVTWKRKPLPPRKPVKEMTHLFLTTESDVSEKQPQVREPYCNFTS